MEIKEAEMASVLVRACELLCAERNNTMKMRRRGIKRKIADSGIENASHKPQGRHILGYVRNRRVGHLFFTVQTISCMHWLLLIKFPLMSVYMNEIKPEFKGGAGVTILID